MSYDICFSFMKMLQNVLSFISWKIVLSRGRENHLLYSVLSFQRCVISVWKKHILTWFFDLLCPSEYFYIIVCDFNKWNEKPLKVSAQTPEEKHPFWYMHSIANTCRTQTKCQVCFQLLEIQREQNSDFLAWMLNEAAEGSWSHGFSQL